MKNILIFLLIWLFSCANQNILSDLKRGRWFGDNTSMMVTENGAYLEFTCASAIISNKISLNDDNKFIVEGIYNLQHGIVPVGYDSSKDRIQARFEGTIIGDLLSLRISKLQNDELLTSVKLHFGVSDRVLKCP